MGYSLWSLKESDTTEHTYTHTKIKTCRKKSRRQGFVADSDDKRPVSIAMRDAQENQDDKGPPPQRNSSPSCVSRGLQHKLPAGIMSGKSSWCG